ncbi:MAG: hypothetical protein JRJ84_25000 [Deltaproteobacteria bacterium]|nr:hypothetical protein [Deltaproteobacteria bacterium]
MSHFYTGISAAAVVLATVACVWIGPNDIGGDVSCLDEDNDGFVARTTCPDLAPGEQADCDETRADRNPAQDELGTDTMWYDGIDQDCDGEDVIDQDGDFYPGILQSEWSAQHANLNWPTELNPELDCDDQDPTVFPNHPDPLFDCEPEPDTGE